MYLLQQLAEKRHKVSKEKLQLFLDIVHYLGQSLNQLSLKRIPVIQEFSRPTTKPQLCRFLGLAGYYGLWVSDFSLSTSVLCELTKISIPEALPQEDKHKQAFIRLK